MLAKIIMMASRTDRPAQERNTGTVQNHGGQLLSETQQTILSEESMNRNFENNHFFKKTEVTQIRELSEKNVL